MIKDTSKTDSIGIRALSDEEIEATTGAGILSDIWHGIVNAVTAVVDFIVGAFGGPQAPWRGPFGNPQQPGTPPPPPRPL
ncbi:MAG: hypothetical protein AB7U75_12125 [Hyphomicrobiaceae bacterium]